MIVANDAKQLEFELSKIYNIRQNEQFNIKKQFEAAVKENRRTFILFFMNVHYQNADQELSQIKLEVVAEYFKKSDNGYISITREEYKKIEEKDKRNGNNIK